MTQRVVLLPDTQMPFDDRRALKAVLKFVGDWQPDHVIHVGDVLDLPQPSRWNKDTKGEFEGSVFKDAEDCKRRLLEPLREVYDGPVGFHEGNHDLRAREYLAKYAPALAGSKAFNFETLLDFDGFGIERLPDFYDVAPGWITTHGHLGKMSLSQIAGYTATNAAKKFGKSVVCGHTHRAGLGSYTFGHGGTASKIVHGLEVGNLMDMKKASYLGGGTANWQQAFGLLTVDKTHVKPEVVPISRGRFTVDGETWEV